VSPMAIEQPRREALKCLTNQNHFELTGSEVLLAARCYCPNQFLDRIDQTFIVLWCILSTAFGNARIAVGIEKRLDSHLGGLLSIINSSIEGSIMGTDAASSLPRAR